MQLVIMAAGMGSRFGGLKQMEPMDEFNNFLLDYSIYALLPPCHPCPPPTPYDFWKRKGASPPVSGTSPPVQGQSLSALPSA